jgi:signal transduction histidine kinase
MERVDFGALVRGMAAEMQPLFDDKDLRLNVSVPSKPIPILADPDGLRRVLAILLDNALKYSYPGGEVALTVESGAEGLALAVSDTGCGIPPESLTRIFDRFYRVDSSRDRKTGGYGLGLSIAQQIARSHQGQIVAESIVGQGSCFRLKLPAG